MEEKTWCAFEALNSQELLYKFKLSAIKMMFSTEVNCMCGLKEALLLAQHLHLILHECGRFHSCFVVRRENR